MSTVISEKLITPDDLLQMEDAVNFELVNGQLVVRNMGMESSAIAARLLGLIWMFLRDHPLGLLFGADGSYKCFADASDKVRKPDLSFVRFGRLPGDRSPVSNSWSVNSEILPAGAVRSRCTRTVRVGG